MCIQPFALTYLQIDKNETKQEDKGFDQRRRNKVTREHHRERGNEQVIYQITLASIQQQKGKKQNRKTHRHKKSQ